MHMFPMRALATALALLALASSSGAVQSEPFGATPFGEKNGEDHYNASGVVPVGGSRFLFCDNNDGSALFELDLTSDGTMKGPLVRRPLEGTDPKALDDLEDMTSLEVGKARYVFVTSSLNAKTDKKTGEMTKTLDSLVRVRYTRAGALRAETMPGFRAWLIARVPRLAEAASRKADEGGLNIEGLAWDTKRQALLFGVRSPLADGKPMLVPVHIKRLNGPWLTENLEVLPEIRLAVEKTDQGIRSIEYDPDRKAFLVIVGRSVSGTATPFELYAWDGGDDGKVRRFDNLTFATEMKPEGVAAGKVDGKRSLVFVDDEGGFGVIRANDPRLK